jgi:hypothetical protein
VVVDCSDHGELRIAHSCATRVDDDSLPLAWRRSPQVMMDLVFSLSGMVIELIIGFGKATALSMTLRRYCSPATISSRIPARPKDRSGTVGAACRAEGGHA